MDSSIEEGWCVSEVGTTSIECVNLKLCFIVSPKVESCEHSCVSPNRFPILVLISRGDRSQFN